MTSEPMHKPDADKPIGKQPKSKQTAVRRSGKAKPNPKAPAEKKRFIFASSVPRADSIYEQVRRRRRRGTGAFWGEGLAVSIGLHLIVLLVLAGVKFGVPNVSRPEIQIQTDIVEQFKPEPLQLRSVITMDKSVSIADRGVELDKQLETKDEEVPVMTVDKLDLGGMDFDLLAKKDRPLETRWKPGDLTGMIVRERGQDLGSAMDAVARPIIQEVAKRELLCVFLFDGSRSLEKERTLLSNQLERTFNDIRFAIVERQERRLHWALVMFGKEARTVLKPTRETKKVQDAIAAMSYDSSGEENVLNAIEHCLDEFGGAKGRLFILLITDEQGSDTGLNGETTKERQAMTRTIAACNRKNARLFVLGRETYLMHSGGWYTITDEGIAKRGYQDVGWSTCRRELPGPNWWLCLGDSGNWMQSDWIVTGFGSFTLSTLAQRTGGTYFIISDKPAGYDPNDMRAYEPEWISPDEYDSRTKASPLRKTLVEAIETVYADISWGAYRGEWSSGQQRWWKDYEDVLEKKMEWCDKTIEKLSRLEKSSGRERHARKRWEANYDLTLAMIYKMNVMLMETREGVYRLLADPPDEPNEKPNEPGTWVIEYHLFPARPDEDIHVWKKRDLENAREKAVRALEKVIRSHDGTPWADQARSELNTINMIVPRCVWRNTTPSASPTIGL